jgi:hypothetical protein
MPRTWVYLDRKPKSHYRQLFIKGRNIAARTIYRNAIDSEDPRTPEQIAADLELPLEAVHEAIAYCESNPPEFQQDWEMEEATIRRGLLEKERQPSSPAPLKPASAIESESPSPRQ